MPLGLGVFLGFRPSDFGFCNWSFHLRFLRHFALRGLDQLLNSLRIAFLVAVAGQRVRAAGGLDQNLRPNQTGLNVYGSHFADAHAHLIHAEPGAFAAAHRLVADLDVSREKQIPARPATGLKNFGWHIKRTLQIQLDKINTKTQWKPKMAEPRTK